jgi:hypothetical protein
MVNTWKNINEFPKYSVSDDGRVRNNSTNKLLTPHTDSNGYLSVSLYRNGKHFIKRIHRLVAEAFIPNPLNLHDINHKDGNKLNNHKLNLEYCTRSYNMLHSYRTLGKKPHSTDRNAVLCVETGMVYPTVEAAAKAVGRSSMAIRKCLYGRTKTAAGCHWRDVV